MTTYSAVPHRTLLALFLALSASLLLLSAGTASAASPIAKDGKIYACYKAKGKGKGALRIVRGTRARCPKQWRKVAWQATPVPGPRGAAGAPGSSSSIQVKEMESRVNQLLTKVASLEAVLKGVSNEQLLAAVRLAPVVQALCGQSTLLTGRLNVLEAALGGLSLNGVLTTLGGLLNIPVLPGALPAFSCPTP